jgi:hypothetical protein
MEPVACRATIRPISYRLSPPPTAALAIYAGAAAVLVAGYWFDGSTCLWRTLTGLPCPGCGMVHALLAMARGDMRAAWAFNRLSVVAVPILLHSGVRAAKERLT